MCWYSEKLKIKRAKKDIPVWKIVISPTGNSCDNICESLYAKHTYLKGELETNLIEFEVNQNGIKGNTGFHSYSNKLKWEKSNTAVFIFKEKILFKAQHIYITGTSKSNTKIARFHIPKGYQYAKNKSGEIISSAIVFDGFID